MARNILGQPGTTTCPDTNALGTGPWFYRVGVGNRLTLRHEIPLNLAPVLFGVIFCDFSLDVEECAIQPIIDGFERELAVRALCDRMANRTPWESLLKGK